MPPPRDAALEGAVTRQHLPDHDPALRGDGRDPLGEQPRLPRGDDERVVPLVPDAVGTGGAADQLRQPSGRVAADPDLRRHRIHQFADLVGVAAGHEPAAEDDGQSGVQRLHLVEQVAGDEQRAWARDGVVRHGPAAHEAHEVVPRHRIEPVERLVEHEQVGIVGHRPGELRPLPHPLGERGERPVDRLAEPDLFERGVRAGCRGAAGESRQPHEIRHPFPRRRPSLRDVGGGAEADPPQHPRVGEGPLAEHADPSHRRPQLPRDEAQQRRLARAVGPQQAVGPAPEIDRHVVDADDRAVELRDVGEGEHDRGGWNGVRGVRRGWARRSC
jgi:hypothetical protein